MCQLLEACYIQVSLGRKAHTKEAHILLLCPSFPSNIDISSFRHNAGICNYPTGPSVYITLDSEMYKTRVFSHVFAIKWSSSFKNVQSAGKYVVDFN